MTCGSSRSIPGRLSGLLQRGIHGARRRPIRRVADLKGKVVATNAAESAVDVAMRTMLRKSGLENRRDYTMVEAPFPSLRAMLAETQATSPLF
jgi:ABC-type nitrate/sulfonate/bicarbonate transport system substrate-binding protein